MVDLEAAAREREAVDALIDAVLADAETFASAIMEPIVASS
jgi:hypothetical protein